MHSLQTFMTSPALYQGIVLDSAHTRELAKLFRDYERVRASTDGQLLNVQTSRGWKVARHGDYVLRSVATALLEVMTPLEARAAGLLLAGAMAPPLPEAPPLPAPATSDYAGPDPNDPSLSTRERRALRAEAHAGKPPQKAIETQLAEIEAEQHEMDAWEDAHPGERHPKRLRTARLNELLGKSSLSEDEESELNAMLEVETQPDPPGPEA